MKRDALVFDLDGTLVDSVPDLAAALNAMLGERGLAPLSAAEVTAMVGDGAAMLVRRAIEARAPGLAEVDEHRCRTRFLNLYEADPVARTTVYPGVLEALRQLRDLGCQLAICTNKPHAATLAVLRGLGLDEFFEAVVGGDSTASRKPDPAPVLAALHGMGADPARAVMIGDSENDAAAGLAAGLKVIMVSSGYLRVPRDSLRPDVWIDRFEALPRALSEIGSI